MAAFDPVTCFGKASNSALDCSLIAESIEFFYGSIDGHDALYLAMLMLRVEKIYLASGFINYLANFLLVRNGLIFSI